MFRKNEGHKQQRMFTAVDQLPETARKHLMKSWAHVFYHEFFCRLDETVFSVLYSEKHSRPNTPINILVGFETLKSGFGLSDERLYEHFMFDLKFRYALGLRDFDEGNFELRTIYNFRSAVSAYEEEYGINLIHKASEQITDEQLKQFQIKTGLQRMDSTMVQSNIRKMSRLQLLVEIIHRFYRMLSEEEQQEHGNLFADYVKEDSLHYCYRVNRDEIDERLVQVGKDLLAMLERFEKVHGDEKAYQQAFRVFGEHFCFQQGCIVVRESKELGGSTLQSPDDEEATFRTKSRESSRGYVANLTETCDEENELQLITRMNVAPNTTDDQQVLAEDIENLKEREGIDELYTDAGYTGETAAQTTRSVIHPVGGHLCKLPVRGQHRITTLMVLSAMMVNIRRITGYLFPEDGSKSIPDGYSLC